MYHTQVNKRVFDVSIEGTEVLSNFDIFAQAGGRYIALDRTFQVTVTDGQLNIQFSKNADGIDHPAFSAIHLQKLP